jgi:hypothetical protein
MWGWEKEDVVNAKAASVVGYRSNSRENARTLLALGKPMFHSAIRYVAVLYNWLGLLLCCF